MFHTQFFGWFGGLFFVIVVCLKLWLHSTDDGLAFRERNRSIFIFLAIAFVGYFVIRTLWIATDGFTSNPLSK